MDDPVMTARVLEVRGLSKAFGGVRAVDDVHFVVSGGELLAMIGPNGAGKSTCFNMLNGQLRPDAGSVMLERRSIVGLPPRQIWRLGVGRTFQITATFVSMTVRENVQMALISHRRRLGSLLARAGSLYVAEANALLERVAMRDQAERVCGVLAYGDLKRVELAVALANEPRLLLMDEPTAGMAPKERIQLMELTAAQSWDSTGPRRQRRSCGWPITAWPAPSAWCRWQRATIRAISRSSPLAGQVPCMP